MLINVAVHSALDMTGALTFYCLLTGCRDSSHRHAKLLRPLLAHRWITQAVSSVIVAIITVKVVG